MGSILSSNPSPQTTADTTNPLETINNLINKILGSANPQATFQQFLNSNEEARNAYNLMNQYGNGDPKAAFTNYAAATGKQSMGQQLMQGLIQPFMNRFGMR